MATKNEILTQLTQRGVDVNAELTDTVPTTRGGNVQPIPPVDINKPVNPEIVKPTGATYTPPAPQRGTATSVTLDALANQEPMQPEPVDTRKQVEQGIAGLLNRDITAEKNQLREDADLITKREDYNRALNDYKSRKMAYEDRIEEMRKNPDGKLTGALNADIEEYQRKANRDLANMAIGVELLQNNYTGAEKILNDQISDLNTDYNNRLNTLSTAYSFLQNDLSESEKMQAQAEIQRIQDERDFEQEKLLIDYKNQVESNLGTSAPTVKEINGQSMQWDSATGVWKPVPTGATADTTQQTKDKLTFLRNTVKDAKDLASAAGPSRITRFTGDLFVGDTKFRQLEQLSNTLKTNVLTLMTDPTIRDFFGPQMSEADVRMMTSVGTTLDPQANSPKSYREEIERLDNLFNRMQTAIETVQGSTGTVGGNVITAPDGSLVEIID